MIDFSRFEVGVIKSKDGIILILGGKMFGPFNKEQTRKVIKVIESID